LGGDPGSVLVRRCDGRHAVRGRGALLRAEPAAMAAVLVPIIVVMWFGLRGGKVGLVGLVIVGYDFGPPYFYARFQYISIVLTVHFFERNRIRMCYTPCPAEPAPTSTSSPLPVPPPSPLRVLSCRGLASLLTLRPVGSRAFCSI
jgi:hypothetical protein